GLAPGGNGSNRRREPGPGGRLPGDALVRGALGLPALHGGTGGTGARLAAIAALTRRSGGDPDRQRERRRAAGRCRRSSRGPGRPGPPGSRDDEPPSRRGFLRGRLGAPALRVRPGAAGALCPSRGRARGPARRALSVTAIAIRPALSFVRIGFLNMLAYRARYYVGVLTYLFNVAVYY